MTIDLKVGSLLMVVLEQNVEILVMVTLVLRVWAG